MHICTNSPLPTFAGIVASVEAGLAALVVAFELNLSTILPTLLNPIYATIRHIKLQILQLIEELQTFQLLTTIMAIISPLVNFLGLVLADFLPKIPGLVLNLIDLLALRVQALYDGIRSALATLGAAIFQFVPIPIYLNLHIPDFEIVDIVKLAIKGYMAILVTTIVGLISQVVGILKIPGLPAIPDLPTLAALVALVLAMVPAFPDLRAMFDGMVKGAEAIFAGLALEAASIMDMLSNLRIPGFPPLPKLVAMLISQFESLEIEFVEGLNILYGHLLLTPLQIIMDFIVNTLGRFISFTFPTICVEF